MGGHAKPRHFFHLEFDVAIYHIIRKHATPGKKVAILIQAIQCLIQRGTRVGNPGASSGGRS